MFLRVLCLLSLAGSIQARRVLIATASKQVLQSFSEHNEVRRRALNATSPQRVPNSTLHQRSSTPVVAIVSHSKSAAASHSKSAKVATRKSVESASSATRSVSAHSTVAGEQSVTVVAKNGRRDRETLLVWGVTVAVFCALMCCVFRSCLVDESLDCCYGGLLDDQVDAKTDQDFKTRGIEPKPPTPVPKPPTPALQSFGPPNMNPQSVPVACEAVTFENRTAHQTYMSSAIPQAFPVQTGPYDLGPSGTMLGPSIILDQTAYLNPPDTIPQAYAPAPITIPRASQGFLVSPPVFGSMPPSPAPPACLTPGPPPPKSSIPVPSAQSMFPLNASPMASMPQPGPPPPPMTPMPPPPRPNTPPLAQPMSPMPARLMPCQPIFMPDINQAPMPGGGTFPRSETMYAPTGSNFPMPAPGSMPGPPVPTGPMPPSPPMVTRGSFTDRPMQAASWAAPPSSISASARGWNTDRRWGSAPAAAVPAAAMPQPINAFLAPPITASLPTANRAPSPVPLVQALPGSEAEQRPPQVSWQQPQNSATSLGSLQYRATSSNVASYMTVQPPEQGHWEWKEDK